MPTPSLVENRSYQNGNGSPFELTPREIEVLTCIAQGVSYTQTAEKLVISANTVKTHLKRIYSKLDVGNRLQAVTKAKKLGMLD